MASARGSQLRRVGWGRLAGATGVGLYLSRVAAEALPGAWAPWELALLAAAGLLLAGVAWVASRRFRVPIGPISLLWAYVLWPAYSPTFAWAVGLGALVAWLWLLPGRRLPRLAVGGGTLLAGLALYVATVAPTVLPADSGEFQVVAAVLGIAHPPGYPLYTLLGKLATLLPVGDVAFRLNLLSTLFGAATLPLIAAMAQGVGVQRPRSVGWAGALAALALAFSPTFWSQATTANIRSLTALFTVLCLLLASRWAARRSPGRLAAFGLALGLAIGHHSSLGLVALPLVAYVLAVDPRLPLRPRNWLPALGALLASFVILLYLPIRSAMQPPFDPVPVDSVGRFVEHVLATGFRGDMFYFRTLPELLERAHLYLDILRLQFGPVLPWAMLLSLAWVLLADWRLGMLLGGVWLVNAATALTYRAPQTIEYLLPSYVAMACCMARGLALALERLPRWGAAALLACLSVAVAWNGLAAWPDFRMLHADRDARHYAEAILEHAPAQSVILANWHWATPLWYLQQVEGWRPDVTIEYVYPEGALANDTVWLTRIAAALEAPAGQPRAVVVTNRFHAYEATGYLFEPLGQAWLVRPEPPSTPPPEATRVGIALGRQVSIEAFQLGGGAVEPGQSLRVILYWRPIVPLEHDYAVFVQLLGPQGVVGQADRAQLTSRYAVGALRVDVYDLPLLLQTPPGEYSLIAGFYRTVPGGWERLATPDGEDHVTLGAVHVGPGNRRPATTRPLSVRYTVSARLVGLDVDRSVPGQTRLYLHWAAETSLPPELRVTVLEEGRRLAEATLPALGRGQTATLALDLPAASERVGLRVETREGVPIRTRGPWGLPWRRTLSLRLPQGPLRYVPLGGELVYLGLAEEPGPAAPGRALRVRPRLMAMRPLARDYSLSVGLASAAPPWERKDDGTPAMGAIPTLKWLTGWTIASPLWPTPPDDAPPGQAQLTLTVYDAFTLAPLAVLDERLAREGQGVFLVMGRVTIASR